MAHAAPQANPYSPPRSSHRDVRVAGYLRKSQRNLFLATRPTEVVRRETRSLSHPNRRSSTKVRQCERLSARRLRKSSPKARITPGFDLIGISCPLHIAQPFGANWNGTIMI